MILNANEGARWMRQHMRHQYDALDNILHYWFPRGIHLTTEQEIDAYFEHGLRCAKAVPRKPYLLIQYGAVHLEPALTHYYARAILIMKGAVIDAFRYGISPRDPLRVHLGISVRSAAPKGYGHSAFYPDEASARAAIRVAAEARQASNDD